MPIDYESKMSNRLLKLKNKFQKFKKYDEHEVWLVVRSEDVGNVNEFIFNESYRKKFPELNFLLDPQYHFTLFHFSNKNKLNDDGIFIYYQQGNPLYDGFNVKEGFEDKLISLYGSRTFFTKDRPQAVEYIMRFIIERLFPLIMKKIEKGEIPTTNDSVYLTIEQIMELIRSLPLLSFSKDIPEKNWILDGLAKLEEIEVIGRIVFDDRTSYKFDMKERFRKVGDNIYETFAKKELAYEFDLKEKKEPKITPTEIPYIPNAKITPLLQFLDRLKYFGSFASLKSLKESLGKENIHHEWKSAEFLGFCEGIFSDQIRLTKKGEQFLESDKIKKKEIFHEQALNNIKLYSVVYEKFKIEKTLSARRIEKIIDEVRVEEGREGYGDSTLKEITRTLIGWLLYTENIAKFKQSWYRINSPKKIIETSKEIKKEKEQKSLNGFFNDKFQEPNA
jgi:hypothetical protein